MGTWRNRQIDRELGSSMLPGSPALGQDKRSLIFVAVRAQLEDDHKAPWSLSQKLNAAPYRYTRDGLWTSLLSISKRLGRCTPSLKFGVEKDFIEEGSFGAFVEARLSGTVSQLIDKIVDCSRWAEVK